jgi:hypothetical protein
MSPYKEIEKQKRWYTLFQKKSKSIPYLLLLGDLTPGVN